MKAKIVSQHEIRIPYRLIKLAFGSKVGSNSSKSALKDLWLFSGGKALKNHAIPKAELAHILNVQPDTLTRQIARLQAKKWVSIDAKGNLFFRSWESIGGPRRRGLYIASFPKSFKRFEALLFAFACKMTFQGWGRGRQKKTDGFAAEPPSLGYFLKSLGVTGYRFKSLKKDAIRYNYLKAEPQKFLRLGEREHFINLRKHLHGVPLFLAGNHVISPQKTSFTVTI